MKRWLFVLAGFAGLALVGPGYAAVETDPNKDYTLTAEAGPWLIYATCYVGDRAWESAHEMCLEIRKRYDLPAYILNRSDKERKEQQAELDELHKQYPDVSLALLRRRMPKIQDQCAVLIGAGYKDMDEAHTVMKEIRRLPPDFPAHLMPMLVRVTPTDRVVDGVPQGQLEVARVNPFVNSFVTHNPEVPIQRPTGSKAEDWEKLNRHESLSLLDNPKPWTMVVATYQGAQTIREQSDSGSFLSSLFGNHEGEVLAASGHNAHALAEALRKLGYKAYVLHARWGSIVTVGEFDSKDDKRMPEIHRALQANLQLGPQLRLMAQPLPMEVPHS